MYIQHVYIQHAKGRCTYDDLFETLKLGHVSRASFDVTRGPDLPRAEIRCFEKIHVFMLDS